jgi:mRNA interferase MazF
MRKTRPALIVNDDALGRLPLKVIVPITDWKDHYSIVPWMVKIEPDIENGLVKLLLLIVFKFGLYLKNVRYKN